MIILLSKKVARTTSGEGQLYIVKQSNGNDYIVNKYHILCLKLRVLSDFNMEYLKLVSYYHFEDNTLDIDIREYFRLPDKIREALVGFDSDYNEIDISIEEHSIGKFYGFSFETNNEYEDYRFQLFDGTVVHNSTLTGVLSKKIMDDGRGLVKKCTSSSTRKK